MDNNSQDRTWRQRALLIYLLAAVLAGVAVFSYLLRIPGDASNAMVLGLSKTRLILALGLLAGIAFFGFGFIKVGVMLSGASAFWIAARRFFSVISFITLPS